VDKCKTHEHAHEQAHETQRDREADQRTQAVSGRG
jgi:hypothetical protein